MGKNLILCVMLILAAGAAYADSPEYRSVYLPYWELNSQAECDTFISKIATTNINQVFVQVRGRGDAFYFPNRDDSTYPNTEPRGQTQAISPSDFDPLQYLIDKLHNRSPKVEVHAWMTTAPSWSSSSLPSSPSHVYRAHPEWITENSSGTTYTYSYAAPLDLGIPAVQQYLFNVFMDVVRNYDVDGINFDYIRLLNRDSGFDPVAKAQFLADTGWNYDTQNGSGQLDELYNAWRRDQITQLVQNVHSQTMLEKPWVDVSAFLVNFDDQVANLGQGFNSWVANGWIDLLLPGCYSSTVSGTISDWNYFVNRLAANGDQYTRPLSPVVGTYLFVTDPVYDPARNLQSVQSLKSSSRVPDGISLYAQQALFYGGVSPDQPDIMCDDLFNAGGPMDGWADVPTMAHKVPLGAESTSPNPPASLSVTLNSGKPRISFNRPSAAADGDLPVHYRLYRDSNSTIDLYYDNMVMEWWDKDSSRSSFSFDDLNATGTCYYAAVAYDDWNNQAVATGGPVSVSSGTVMVESRQPNGVKTSAAQGYSESGSNWMDSSGKSTAPGLSGSGTRFSSNTSLDASFTMTPNIPSSGYYNIYVTTPIYYINAANSAYSITHPGGTTTGTFALTQNNTGNSWALLASNIYLSAGTGNSVTFSERSPQADRFSADAMKFEPVSGTPTSKEPKPTVIQSSGSTTEIIVDSHPVSLEYQDDSTWSTSSLSGYYNSNARYYPSAGSTVSDYAVWVVDLPQEGQWAIDGWVRHSVVFATGARYRFIDGTGTVRSSTVSQRSTYDDTSSGDWLINVDGVSDSGAYSFPKGRVYVTLYGNTGGSASLIADALRFRLLTAGTPTHTPTGPTPTFTATATPTNFAIPTDIIIESRLGGKNYSMYSDSGFADSGTNCTASGCSSGIGSRYGSTYRSVVGNKFAYFTPDLPVPGTYEVFVAWAAGNNRNAAGVNHKVVSADGTNTYFIDQGATANVWVSLGEHNFNQGTGGYLEVNNLGDNVSGSMYASAAKFVYVVQDTPVPTNTPTDAPTQTPSATPTITPTITDTLTMTPSQAPVNTDTPTRTFTDTPTVISASSVGKGWEMYE